MSSSGDIECLGHNAVEFPFSCYCTLYSKIYFFWEQPGKRSFSPIFFSFLPCFSCVLYCLPSHPFILFIKLVGFFSIPLNLPVLSLLSDCSFFQMEYNDLFFNLKCFTRVWITATPSLFQGAAVWWYFEKPQWHQSWWQTQENARSKVSLALALFGGCILGDTWKDLALWGTSGQKMSLWHVYL